MPTAITPVRDDCYPESPGILDVSNLTPEEYVGEQAVSETDLATFTLAVRE